MNTLGTVLKSASIALAASASLLTQAWSASQTLPAVDGPFAVAAADCYAIGQQVAAENGGTLARASQSTRGGQPVCVVVVLVPGKDGERPRRAEIVVPAN